MKRKNTDSVIIKAIFAKGANIFFLLLKTLILVPILLQAWGSEKYGIWIALYAFFNLITALDLGHGAYIGTEFIKNYNLKFSKAKETLASAFKIAFITSLIQLFLLSLIHTFGFLSSLIKIDNYDVDEIYYCLVIVKFRKENRTANTQ